VQYFRVQRVGHLLPMLISKRNVINYGCMWNQRTSIEVTLVLVRSPQTMLYFDFADIGSGERAVESASMHWCDPV
jgi:hypothetical protein